MGTGLPLSELSMHESGLTIDWHDGRQSGFSYFWLRDNARDSISFDQRSHQRELFTAGLDPDIRPVAAHLNPALNAVEITWPKLAEPVIYESRFLRSFIDIEQPRLAPPSLWTAASLAETDIRHEFKDCLGDAGLRQCLHTLSRFGVVLLANCPCVPDSVTKMANQIGYIRQSIFGGLWQFQANENRADSAYTSKELRPHTDGTYSLDAPGLQILFCLAYDAKGGESIIVDGFKIAQNLAIRHPELYDDLCRIDVTGLYQGDGVMLEASRPIFRHAKMGQIEQVSFNNYDRKSVKLADDDMQQLYEGIRAVDLMLTDSAYQWRYGLKSGEMLIFDNWRCLHGRAAFSGHRHMAGCYINREDYLSRLKTKQAQSNGLVMNLGDKGLIN